MKTTHNILVGLAAASAWLIAGSVTIPHTFHANTTAKAAEVNANFSAVKTAVDGNAGDIATNKTDIANNANDIATNQHDIATNTSNIAAAVTNISVGAGLDINRTDGNVTIKKKSGYVAIHGSAFNNSFEYGNNCVLVKWQGEIGAYFGSASTNSNCKAYANVNLPNRASIKSLTCRVKHNVAGDLHVRLYMQNRSYSWTFPPGPGNIQKSELIDASLAAADQSSDTQEVSGIYTPSGPVLLNPTYRSYYIEWDPHDSSADSTNEVLYDCKVDYEY